MPRLMLITGRASVRGECLACSKSLGRKKNKKKDTTRPRALGLGATTAGESGNSVPWAYDDLCTSTAVTRASLREQKCAGEGPRV